VKAGDLVRCFSVPAVPSRYIGKVGILLSDPSIYQYVRVLLADGQDARLPTTWIEVLR